MLGADMAVAVDDGSGWVARDYWSEGFSFPTLDDQQDVSLVSVTRTNGNTLLELRRPLDTCDPQDRAITNDTALIVVYAYGTGAFGYHGTANRGQSEVTFVADDTVAATQDLSGMLTLDMIMPAYTVPHENVTTYACVNFALPTDRKYHIYRLEPIVDNPPVVHHCVVWACPVSRQRPLPTAPGVPYQCFANSRTPDSYTECEEFFFGWGKGMAAFDAPEDAAFAFGAGSNRYLTLNVHYENVDQTKGLVDSSGFRLYYSPKLKKHDMGTVTLGTKAFAIPAGAKSYTTTGVCPSACTERMAEAAGGGALTLVGSYLHMHGLGRTIVTRHVRGDVELPPVGRRDYFDVDYQAEVPVPLASRTLLPGDVLITTCTFTGDGRTETTRFGPGAVYEMCFNYLTLYPFNPNVTLCHTVAWPWGSVACTTEDELAAERGDSMSMSAVNAARAVGTIMATPRDLRYTPYEPTCARTAASAAAAAPIVLPAAAGGVTGGGARNGTAATRYALPAADEGASGGAKPKSAAAAAATEASPIIVNVSGEEQQQSTRSVGGAVGGAAAAIVVAAVVGGVAVYAVLRVVRRRRQSEEEQVSGRALVGPGGSSSAGV